MSGALAGKICLATGVSRGIGRDTVRAIAAAGATVVVSSRDLAACEALAEEIGGRAMAADVTRAEDMAGLVDFVRAEFGRLDLAFNNAGKILGLGAIGSLDAAEARAAYDLNAGGVLNALNAQIPLMKESGGGAIVVNTAKSGLRGMATAGAYSAAKAAAAMLVQVAALEAGPANIRVNAVAPGYIGTDAWMAKLGAQKDAFAETVPLRRIGTGEDVAQVVTWLLSDAAGYVTGAVIPVDGGLMVA